jgi:hypothetical protein
VTTFALDNATRTLVIEASSEEAGKKVIERIRELILGKKVGVAKEEGAKEGECGLCKRRMKVRIGDFDAVIGTGWSNIKALEKMDGIVRVKLDEETRSLVVTGRSEAAVAAVLDVVQAKLQGKKEVLLAKPAPLRKQAQRKKKLIEQEKDGKERVDERERSAGWSETRKPSLVKEALSLENDE